MAAPSPHLMMRPPTWVCETVAELETEIGLPAGALQATVEYYNAGAARGEDPLLHKKSQWLRPIGSPVGAIDLRNSTGGFTLGGLSTTLSGEVLHVSGEPIPGSIETSVEYAKLLKGSLPAERCAILTPKPAPFAVPN